MGEVPLYQKVHSHETGIVGLRRNGDSKFPFPIALASERYRPKFPVNFFFFFITLGLELSDTKVY
jgi:hypothetical protein